MANVQMYAVLWFCLATINFTRVNMFQASTNIDYGNFLVFSSWMKFHPGGRT